MDSAELMSISFISILQRLDSLTECFAYNVVLAGGVDACVGFAHEFIFKSLRQSLHCRRIYTCTLEFSGGRFDINTCRNLNVMLFKERNDSGKESKNVSSRSARVLAQDSEDVGSFDLNLQPVVPMLRPL